jgi:hypothetical protein
MQFLPSRKICQFTITYTLTEGDLTKPEEGIMKSMEYILPTRLKEWLCVCETSSRPLYLISILYQLCGLISTPANATADVINLINKKAAESRQQNDVDRVVRMNGEVIPAASD